jgi:hypothetical protein
MRTLGPTLLVSLGFLVACEGAPLPGDEAGGGGEVTGRVQQALSWDHVTARITSSDATVVPRSAASDSTWHATLQEDGRDHRIVEQAVSDVGDGNARHAPFSELIARDADCDGGTCLKFSGYGTNYGDHAPRGTNDRIEVEVSTGDQPGGMPLNEWRYLRFFLLVSPATQPPPPGQDIIIAQTWQLHNGPNWRAPAFKISLRAGLKLEFTYYNDEISGYENGIPVYAPHTFHEEPIVTGSWMSFHLAMKAVPKPVSGTGPLGAIMIWKNAGLNYVPQIDQYLINADNKEFNWGYRQVGTDASGACAVTANCVRGLFTQRLGIYRNDSAAQGSFVSFKVDSVKITTDEAFMPGY